MKRTTKVLILIAAFALLAVPCVSAADLNLTIPPRAGLPIAKVQIRIAITPTGVPSLTVQGMSIANDGVFHTLSNSDQILFASSASAALIKYFPYSAVNSATLCTKIGDGHDDVTITYSGFTVGDYRIDSYTVPTNELGCHVAYRRIGSSVATLSGAGTNLGRNRLNLVMILDKSGSMSDGPPGGGGGGASKWDSLKAAIASFIDQWDLEAGAPADDRIGIVFFDDVASVAAIPTAIGTLLQRSQGLTHVNDLFTGGSAPTPGGSTSIGAGLVSAKTVTDAAAMTDPVGDPVYILITDGMQNTPPMVNDPVGAQTVDTVPAILADWGVPIQTVAFGTPAETETNLLDHMAHQTFGTVLRTLTDLGMASTLAMQLVNTLKGNTVSLALNVEGSVFHGAGPVHTFLTDGAVSRIIFNLQWPTGSMVNALGLQVFPPGADPATATPVITIRRDAQFSTSQAVDIPATGPAGLWSVRAVSMQASTAERPFPYGLTAILQETRLDYAISFDELRDATGGQLKMRAEIAWDGKPLSGLGNKAVLASITRPNEAIGNILHESGVPQNILNPPSPPADSTRYGRKLKFLIDNGNLLDRVKPQPLTSIALHDAGDGNYTGTFSDTSKPGEYGFDVALEWDDPRTGHIKRIEHITRDVVVQPDAAHSQVVKTANGGGQWTVSITPLDKFGNYYGPGGLPHIKLTVNPPATILTPLSDPDETGTYVATIGNVPPGDEPHIDATVDGVSVVPGTSTGPLGPSGHYRWFFDIGPNFPHGSFHNGVDGKWSANFGLEKLLASNNSVELIGGYHRFDTPFVSNPHIWQLSVGAKHYFGAGPWHEFVNGGIGAYRFDPGNTTKGGANAGFGVLYDLSAVWGIEGVYNYHWINASGSSVQFSTLQIGLRHSF